MKDHFIKELEQEIERIWLHIDHLDDISTSANYVGETDSVTKLFAYLKS